MKHTFPRMKRFSEGETSLEPELCGPVTFPGAKKWKYLDPAARGNLPKLPSKGPEGEITLFFQMLIRFDRTGYKLGFGPFSSRLGGAHPKIFQSRPDLARPKFLPGLEEMAHFFLLQLLR